MDDKVNHPSHYNHGGIECIDGIAAATCGLEGLDAVCTGNVIKYMWRWKFKNGIEDLQKAKWYLDKLIQRQKALAILDKMSDPSTPISYTDELIKQGPIEPMPNDTGYYPLQIVPQGTPYKFPDKPWELTCDSSGGDSNSKAKVEGYDLFAKTWSEQQAKRGECGTATH